jgi:hypothetical protein
MYAECLDLPSCGRASQGCAERRSDTRQSSNKGKSEGRSGTTTTTHTIHNILHRANTSLKAHNTSLQSSSLTQDMHNLVIPLRLRDIVTGPGISGVDDIRPQVSRSLFADAIKRLHPDVIYCIFTTDMSVLYPAFPII